MHIKRTLVIGLILALLAGNVILFIKNKTLGQELRANETIVARRTFNKKLLDFSQLFIDKVLRSKKEVSFEDRLQLEDSARGLNDPEVKTVWDKFVDSQTEAQAQNAAKNLLSILVHKLQPN